MNTKTTAIVVVIALALGVYLLVFQRDLLTGPRVEEPPAPAGQVSGRPVLAEGAIASDEVKRVRIERADEPAIVIERADSGWMQIEPVRFPLQRWDIDQLISDAAGLRYTAQLTPSREGLKLEDLGLAPPRVKLTLETQTAKSTVVYLGRRMAAGGAYLTTQAPTESGDVLVVGDSLHNALLDKKPQDWRSRTLASVTPGSVQRVQLKRDGETVEMVQSEGRWVIERPVLGRADREAAQQVARIPNEARIVTFVKDQPQDLSVYGLADPQIVLTLEVSQTPAAATPKADEAPPEPATQTHTLKVGAPQTLSDDNYFAMWDDLPVVFTLAKADVQKLRRPLDELRDPRLTSADRAAVREILLRQPPEGLLHFVKDAGVWKFGDSAPPFELDGAAVDELLAAIFETRADDYIPADAEKLGQPAAVITLALTGSEQTEKMALYHAEDDRFISVRGSESTGYIIDAESLEPIFRSAIGYRDRTVWDIDGESVAELRLTRGGEQAADYHITRDEAGAWKLEGYDRGAVEALLQRIAPLMADGWIVDPPATAPEGITIELTLKDGATKKATLDPGSHLAVAADVQGVFRVREDVSQSAMAELRDRVVIKTELGEIATVRLGDASIARDRNGLYQIEGDEQLTEQKAAGIFDALAGLTVERYLPPHDRGQPTHRLTFATRDGQEQTLALWAPGPDSPSAPWIGRLGEGGYFSLSHEAAQGLTATGDVPPPPDK